MNPSTLLPCPLICLLSLYVATSVVAEVPDQQRPNIIYIMSDDMGYSDIGCYGSEIQTPQLDQLAANGLRFTQFYNTARCCPTRACLLTGLYPHQAGIGHMMSDSGFDGYRGELNRHCVTLAEVLRGAGYRTYMSGKWHVTQHVKPENEQEKQNWPLQRGFDRFYGTIHGAGSFFDPNSLTRDNTLISPFSDPEYEPKDGFYYTDAIADQASRFVREHDGASPFFMYVSFTAAHWPMHARPRDIQKYAGHYDSGYDAIRDRRYRKMIELGVIEQDATTNWPLQDAWKEQSHLAWDIHNMEVYAAMIDSMDQGIGRILSALRETQQLDNTLILFFQDNGGCAEGYGRKQLGPPRAAQASLEPLAEDYLQPDMEPKQTRDGFPVRTGKGVWSGPADTYIAYGKAWASVSNTPFREYKHWVHEGGISSPLIAHWPAAIDRAGEIEHTPGHLIDLMATAVDVADADYPTTFHDGQEITPMEGKSLLTAFAGDGIQRDALYWEHEGNRAIRVGDFKLVAKGAEADWELYNIAQDRSEQHDLAGEKTELVKQLAAKWQAWAERAQVLPLTPYRKPKKKNNASFNKQKRKFALQQGDNLDRYEAPFVKGRGLRFTAKLQGAGDGVIAAQGGVTHGWSLFVLHGRLAFAVTQNGQRQEFIAEQPLQAGGKVSFRMEDDGQCTLRHGQQVLVQVKVKGPLAAQPQDGLQIGYDEHGNVGNYEAPFAFGGEISQAEIRLYN